MNHRDLLKCRAEFEAQALLDGEAVHLDSNGAYRNVLHRVQWRRWVVAWESCLKTQEPSSLAPADPPNDLSSDLLRFLHGCRTSGLYFDGTDAAGQPGIFFVTKEAIDALCS